MAGAFNLPLSRVFERGRVGVFGLVFAGLDLAACLVLAVGLDLAFRDGDLARLTVPALVLDFVLFLVFVATLAFADFVVFLATMRAPLFSE